MFVYALKIKITYAKEKDEKNLRNFFIYFSDLVAFLFGYNLENIKFKSISLYL
jgi:hypothetical protein